MSEIQLNNEQDTALIALTKMIVSSNPFVATLSGPAGTGKTTLCRNILKVAQQSKLKVIGVAPTHKAKKVLRRSLNHKSFATVFVTTVASLLNKMKQHSYIGTNRYQSNGSNKMSNFDLFIIDEASMICDDDTEAIIDYGTQHGQKILFVGDSAQIPNPQQILEENRDGSFSKSDSLVFDLENHFALTTIMRQTSSNPLIDVYDFIRKNLCVDLEFDRTTKLTPENNGITYITSPSKFNSSITECFKNTENKLDENKVICYTNESVRFYNKLVRKALGILGEPFPVGWLLMGYENTGWPEPFISNGQDYYIREAILTTNHKLNKNTNLTGHLVKLQEADSNVVVTVFFPTVSDDNNYDLMCELVKFAKKVNARGSTKEDFKNYVALKNTIFFTESIYCIEGEILTESEIQGTHPLLTNATLDVMDENGTITRKNELTEKIQSKYPGMLEFRARDTKTISNVEKLYDRFKILNKDLDDGVAITAHKSQGSTYDTVFICESDFNKVTDMWNYQLELLEKRTKEKNQLLYVAYTRPRNNAVVLYSK